MSDVPRIFASARSRRTTVALLVVVIGLFVAGSVALGRLLPDLTNPLAIRAYVRQQGPLAPLAFVVLQAAQIVIAPIPGQTMGFIGGYLFGAAMGTLYSVVGAAIGTFLALSLSRRFGRPYVERAIDPEALAGFDELAGRRGLFVLFLVFLIPGLPDDVICFIGGLTELRIRDMLVASIFGRLPSYVIVNLAGDTFAASRYPETAVLVGVVSLVAFAVYAYRDEVTERLLSSGIQDDRK
ncbi:MAG TPA: TVP38/TMEM64 family protein [Natrialbaceae archaeon]|nr:TVP38/TMEM64 family protein [Natrialbaceae archaeon]